MISTHQSPTWEETAAAAHCALLIGAGGGADVLQTVPVMNHLRRLGLQRFVLANVGAYWWAPQGQLPFGADLIQLEDLQPGETLHAWARLNSAATRWLRADGQSVHTYEALLAELFDVPTVTLTLDGGAAGLIDALAALRQRYEVDLVVGVDFGADSFYSGVEQHVGSPLIDALVLAALAAQPVPALFVLSGYGCDAEMSLPELDRNVGRVMAAGGFLGAFGLTPQDVEALETVFARLSPDEMERLVLDAAHGRLGTRSCKRFWHVTVTPLAAVDLVFDPRVIVEALNPLPRRVAASTTRAEAEQAVLDCGLIPETRAPLHIPLT